MTSKHLINSLKRRISQIWYELPSEQQDRNIRPHALAFPQVYSCGRSFNGVANERTHISQLLAQWSLQRAKTALRALMELKFSVCCLPDTVSSNSTSAMWLWFCFSLSFYIWGTKSVSIALCNVGWFVHGILGVVVWEEGVGAWMTCSVVPIY